MSNPLPSYRLKIERAKRHIQEISEAIAAFNARNPYTVTIDVDAQQAQRIWKITVNERIPEAWSTIVGDAIHNVRAALDLLMVAVVKHCDPNRISYNHVHFVIRESKEKFEAALPKNIQGASPEARQIIENLKPYKGGDEAFYRLHQLDVLDKHKAIIPVGAAHAGVGMRLDMARAMPDTDWLKDLPVPTIFFKPANRQFPLQDGAAVFGAPLTPPPFDDEVQIGFDVAFGEGQIIDGEPIVPALTQIVQFVEGVADIIERNILQR